MAILKMSKQLSEDERAMTAMHNYFPEMTELESDDPSIKKYYVYNEGMPDDHKEIELLFEDVPGEGLRITWTNAQLPD